VRRSAGRPRRREGPEDLPARVSPSSSRLELERREPGETAAAAFEHHLDETEEQVRRLEKAMKAISFALPPRALSPGMRGLLDAGEEVIEGRGEPAALDAALIAAAQRVEHYAIAGSGTARALARELGFGNVRSLLSDTLAEEGNADRTLTKLALGGLVTSGINEGATTR
jgi:ferritin-like metal-binding protein YciE